jgi:hypothetical protein
MCGTLEVDVVRGAEALQRDGIKGRGAVPLWVADWQSAPVIPISSGLPRRPPVELGHAPSDSNDGGRAIPPHQRPCR